MEQETAHASPRAACLRAARLDQLRAGEEDLTVLKPGPGETPAGKRLYTYLEGQAKTHFDARRKAVAALKTPEDVAKRQAELQGEVPRGARRAAAEKTPLNARVVGRDARDGYRVERVIYESRPGTPRHGHALPARRQAAVPRRARPLRPQRQRQGGRDVSADQHPAGQERHGRALLRPDRPGGAGPGARRRRASRRSTGSTTEHTMARHRRPLLVGRSTAGYRIWDGIRSLDYLASRPEIDPTRLGCTGNSGGGTLTAYLMALDDRIVAAAPSCYITSLERLFATIGPQDAEQNITGQVAFGMEHADYVTMRGPEADPALRRHAGLLRHPGTLGHLPRGEADLRPARPRRARRPLRVGREARLHPAQARGVHALDAPLAAREGRRSPSRPTSRSPPTRTSSARRPARCSASSTARSRSSTSTPSGPRSSTGNGPTSSAVGPSMRSGPRSASGWRSPRRCR